MIYGNTQSPLDNFFTFIRSRSVLARLMLINLVVFAAISIVNLFLFLFQISSGNPSFGVSTITYWLSVPSDISQLLLRPWTLVTYMFLQEGFFHLFFNMIILYFGGRIFTEYLDEKKLLKTYIFSGLLGAAFFILAFNAFPAFADSVPKALALGSSASVLGILIAIATYVPEYTVTLLLIGRIKLEYIAIIFIAIDIFSIPSGNAGGHIAHIGGAVWGFLYASNLKKGKDLATFFDRIKWPTFKFSSGRKKKHHFEDVYVNRKPMTDEEYNARKMKHQKNIDRILEKISRSGYQSLTKEEKEILFKNSKQ
ncbi:MAG TPA: rhomboid family intramembrane serine protease [Bacteroidales bacterium]|nr:rhomboid family intramembrane serine protease [Bacteroidales bacterium]